VILIQISRKQINIFVGVAGVWYLFLYYSIVVVCRTLSRKWA